MVKEERLAEAARKRAERERRWKAEGEVSFSRRLGQIGVLGWLIVLPTLGALFLGRWLDRTFDTGIFFSAPLLFVGLGIGAYAAWKWIMRT
ncbi:AtpZ/AtpI family protein [Albibacillus kandeliae]|uniref:AtpZ/AtpI family protein n=1 Tax=Albibacillus kandeliae TaxID=2174228 RepID=UPI000D6976F3|nr:AtpZ/AtpI family protein [Albibacillus kandeliae]